MVKSSTPGKVGVPSYINHPMGVFDDIEHYSKVVRGIAQGLARKNTKNRTSTSSHGSYLFDSLVVEFSNRYSDEEIFLDHLNAKIVLKAPQADQESSDSLQNRRIYYLGILSREVEAMKTIGITQIYLALKPEGREKLDSSG